MLQRFLLVLLAAGCLLGQVQVIETPNATLRLSKRSGDLVGVRWKNPALDILQEPKLGENFRLLLPNPGYEAAYFNSTDQQVSRIEPADGGVTCYYESLKNGQETVPLRVAYHIRTAGRQLQFSIEVENPTDRPLAEAYFGILGGLRGIGERTATESMVPGFFANLAPALFTKFQGGYYGGGNLGIRYSAGGWTYPGALTMGWMDIYNRKAGVGIYYANQDPETRVTALYTEMRPYTKSAEAGDSWPSAGELPPGEPLGLTMGWMYFPYVKNGRFVSGPVALEVHAGDWHKASEIYRAWFDGHFQVKRAPDWLRKEMAWQSIIISNCEDVVVHRFKDLPRLAADAKKYGVTTFEILGWDMGGIDRGYPDYRPDPRLGTRDEFRQALREIREMGVHPVIFSNVQVADTATQMFKDELHRYTMRGRWADDLFLAGWGEGTIGARLGLARSNMTFISPSQPAVHKLLLDQYLQLIRDGAEAFQLDKTGGVGMLDFNPSLPVPPDKSMPVGMLEKKSLQHKPAIL
ncbi:MAG: alpha-amylase family protein [Acidobacteria bacterium]|nr:alpha-amylase family protein [Acidobacteriota bacterium]